MAIRFSEVLGKMKGSDLGPLLALTAQPDIISFAGGLPAPITFPLKELEEEGKGAVVYGRDIVTGLPVEREIPTRMVDESLEEHFNTIIDNVKVILERTPPELAADIYRHGIYLTGGASQVSHLAERLATGTGLHVNVAENPLTSVATGLAKIIKDDNYKSVAYAIEGMSK